MKKIVSIILSTALTMSFLAACGADTLEQTPSTSSAITTPPASSGSESQKIEVTQGLLTVDIIMPESVILSMQTTAEEYAAGFTGEDGFIGATVNDNGSVTLTYTKAAYNKQLADIEQGIIAAIEDILADENYSSIKTITAAADFSRFEIIVDKVAFENNLYAGMLSFGLGMAGTMYLVYTGKSNPSVELNYIDEATGKVFKTSVWPEDFSTSS